MKIMTIIEDMALYKPPNLSLYMLGQNNNEPTILLYRYIQKVGELNRFKPSWRATSGLVVVFVARIGL